MDVVRGFLAQLRAGDGLRAPRQDWPDACSERVFAHAGVCAHGDLVEGARHPEHPLYRGRREVRSSAAAEALLAAEPGRADDREPLGGAVEQNIDLRTD